MMVAGASSAATKNVHSMEETLVTNSKLLLFSWPSLQMNNDNYDNYAHLHLANHGWQETYNQSALLNEDNSRDIAGEEIIT